MAKYFTKGRMAVVEGRIQNRDWEGRDGEKRRSTEIVADNVYFGDSKPRSKDGDSEAEGQTPDDFVPDFNEQDGELPF